MPAGPRPREVFIHATQARHEGATDPGTGYVYETVDTGDSVLYHFRPANRSDLASGGVLEAMKR